MLLHVSEHNSIEQAHAAEALPKVLTNLSFWNAFIGGYVWALLGNDQLS
jgi:hypothetical protein